MGGLVLQQDCEYDSVVLRSGFDDGGEEAAGEGKVHGAFCGSTLPQPITSDGNKLRITFSTDNTVQKSGFSAVFFTGIVVNIYRPTPAQPIRAIGRSVASVALRACLCVRALKGKRLELSTPNLAHLY